MFGMAGFQLLPFYDAVRELGLSHTLINDERCGVFAADAWARVTGRPGICDAHARSGSHKFSHRACRIVERGGCLSLSSLATAIVHILGKNMTQEARQSEILAPSVKALIRIEDGLRIPELVRRAYAIATSGRTGSRCSGCPRRYSTRRMRVPKRRILRRPRHPLHPSPPSSSGA